MLLKKYIQHILKEVKWEDSYRKGFIEFRKKYLKLANKGLYVRFSFTADSLERNANQNPDHHDPVGIYAYPLKYVVNNPSDVWYGRNSKYIQVINPKLKKPLYLSDISKNELESLFYRIKADESLINIIKKTNKFSGSTMYGKIFFFAIQHDLSKFNKEEKSFEFRTPIEQTKLLTSLGYDSIIDMSNTAKKAVVNEREPEQIIFLNRYAFEIIDVFNLNLSYDPKKDLTVAGHHVDSPENHKIFVRKLAQNIAVILGSKLKEGGKYENSEKTKNTRIPKEMFWTTDGQQISIDFILAPGFIDGRNFGEKRHKEFKLFDYQTPVISLITKKGKFNHTYKQSDSFESILKSIKVWFDSKESDPSFLPIYKKDYIEDLYKEKQEWIKKHSKKERIQKFSESKEAINSLNEIAQFFNINFNFNTEEYSEQQINEIGEFVKVYINLLKNRSKKDKNESINWDEFNQNFDSFIELNREDGEFNFIETEGYEYTIKDILQKLFNKVSINYGGNYPWILKYSLRDLKPE